MPKIIPIRDLAKTSQISEMCRSSREPIYVTKNGYADLVILNAEEYDAQVAKYELYEAAIEGNKDKLSGRVISGEALFDRLDKRYDQEEI